MSRWWIGLPAIRLCRPVPPGHGHDLAIHILVPSLRRAVVGQVLVRTCKRPGPWCTHGVEPIALRSRDAKDAQVCRPRVLACHVGLRGSATSARRVPVASGTPPARHRREWNLVHDLMLAGLWWAAPRARCQAFRIGHSGSGVAMMPVVSQQRQIVGSRWRSIRVDRARSEDTSARRLVECTTRRVEC